MSTSSNQDYGFVCMSTTVDDLSYTPSEQERCRDAEQFVATGRRSWKTLKGKGEAVWPPILEAALLEALERYQPENLGVKSDKVLGRFPMRNRFISDYIFEMTGKTRTPKQVGSRLQQLRDTCKKEKILQLISHSCTPEPASTNSDCSPENSPSPPPGKRRRTSPSFEKAISIFVKIVLQSDLWPTPMPSIDLSEPEQNGPQEIQFAPSGNPPANGSPYRAQTPSAILPFLNGSVHFISPYTLLPQSIFNIYTHGFTSAVHTETVTLKCVPSTTQNPGWMYTSEIAPNFWGKLCSSQDVTQYTIVQTLQQFLPDSSNAVAQGRSISMYYRFSPIPQAPPRRSRASSPSPLGLSELYSPNQMPSNVDSSLLHSHWAPTADYSPDFSSNYEGNNPSFDVLPTSAPYPFVSNQCLDHAVSVHGAKGTSIHVFPGQDSGPYYPPNLNTQSNFGTTNQYFYQPQSSYF